MGNVAEVSVSVDGVVYRATASPPKDAPWGVARTVSIFRGAESLGEAILFPIRIMGGGDGWSVGDQDSDELTDDVLVRVVYSREALEPMAAKVREAFRATGTIRGVTMYAVTGERDMYGATGPGVSVYCCGLEFMSRQVAERLLSGAGACVRHSDCAEHVELGIACAAAAA